MLKVYLSSMFRIMVLSILLLFSCQTESDIIVVDIPNPSKASSGEPNLTSNGNELILSWIEEHDSLDILHASQCINQSFQSHTKIASSSDWFVNWADFPGVVSFEDSKHQLSYWLQMRDSGTYDYDIHISLSKDNGKSWGTSQVLHDDGKSAEHGFVSTTLVDNGMMLVWLDGREMVKTKSHEEGHSHGSGAMTLRSAIVTSDGKIIDRHLIDNRVCECCQTDVVNSECGPVVVYRNRSNHEIRDIYFSRYYHDAWTDPRPIYIDNWKINGCPVNGPRIASSKDLIVATWFSQSENEPKVQFVISTDCGKTFSEPYMIGKGKNIMGRIDVQIREDHIFISHMEKDSLDAAIVVSDFTLDGNLNRQQTVARNGLSRKSGFPRMAVSNKDLYISFRDLSSDRIKTLKLLL